MTVYLDQLINDFINYWAPHDDQREVFEKQLRELLSECGAAAVAQKAAKHAYKS